MFNHYFGLKANLISAFPPLLPDSQREIEVLMSNESKCLTQTPTLRNPNPNLNLRRKIAD